MKTTTVTPAPEPPAVAGETSGVADELLVARTIHELASPLTVIDGFSEMLLNHRAELSDEQCQRYLETIRRHVGRLQRLVADLGHLQQARAYRDCADPARTDVRAAIDDALEISASLHGVPVTGEVDDIAGSLDVHVDVDRNAAAWVDEGHLVRMVLNLLDNSLKYGRAPRRVTARATSTGVAIRVADDGDGIPDDLQGRLFEPYARGDKQRVAGIPGSGLGLSIVLELARCNRATVSHVPTTVGASFEIVLPTEPDPQDPSAVVLP